MSADAVFNQIPVRLGPEMCRGVFQPGKNLQSLFVSERLENRFQAHRHDAILPSDDTLVKRPKPAQKRTGEMGLVIAPDLPANSHRANWQRFRSPARVSSHSMVFAPRHWMIRSRKSALRLMDLSALAWQLAV